MLYNFISARNSASHTITFFSKRGHSHLVEVEDRIRLKYTWKV